MNVSPANGGTVEIDGESHTTYPTNVTFDSGKSVIIEAIPAVGFTFSGWRGALTDVTNPVKITMTCPKTITANFSPIMHDLGIYINGGGSTNPSAGSHSYAEGEIITMVATADSGWRFDSWTGDVSDSKSPDIKVEIDTSKNITANFVKENPAWLLPLIIIVGLALIGIAGWYYIKHKYKRSPTKREPVANPHEASRSKKHRKKKRR